MSRPTLHVAELWRFPVKSLAGGPLTHAALRHDGIAGDRLIHVQDAHLVAHDEPERFDILPLLIATDGAITTFGAGGRRLRPNAERRRRRSVPRAVGR